jgi:hypothetical protein
MPILLLKPSRIFYGTISLGHKRLFKMARSKYAPTLIGLPDRLADARVIKIDDI